MIGSQDLSFFAAISRASSLAEAARALNVTAPAVSQRLKQLEEKLGAKLIDRVRGAICLTSEGELLLSSATGILADIDVLNATFMDRRTSVFGTLRIIAPLGFGREHVSAIMAKFKTQHPQVSICLNLSDSPLMDARNEPWDVIVNIGKLPDSSMIQQRLASNRRVLCAAPKYLETHGYPSHPKDLTNHACGVIRENEDDVTLWTFLSSNGPDVEKKTTYRVIPSFACNDGEVVKNWAKWGMGIIERSEWDVASDFVSGDLIEVMANYRLPNADIVALASQKTLRVARTQHFLDFLRKEISAQVSGGWLRKQV